MHLRCCLLSYIIDVSLQLLMHAFRHPERLLLPCCFSVCVLVLFLCIAFAVYCFRGTHNTQRRLVATWRMIFPFCFSISISDMCLVNCSNNFVSTIRLITPDHTQVLITASASECTSVRMSAVCGYACAHSCMRPCSHPCILACLHACTHV